MVAASFAAGDLVYVPDTKADKAFVPGKIEDIDRSGAEADIILEPAGERQRVRVAELRQRYIPNDGVTSQDNTSLDVMNDATILENLRVRHGRDEIYTYTASVLLAVNPYKDISGLYSDEQCGRYRGKHIGALPPHPYAIADTAYRALVRENINQGMLISGESGAGKTETAKIVMQFLAYASGATSSHADSIQARVLRTQPILESFGNAVTMRNSNSSRFGKYNRVFFDNKGALVDAGITTYLLESSRVVVHGDNERTYHCFYEMLRGLDDERLKAFGLERNKQYRLLTSAGGQPRKGFEERDAANFERLCNSFRTMGMDEASINEMFQVLAGLIHLGNLEKDGDEEPERSEDDGEPVQVNDTAVEWAAKLLGMDADALFSRMTKKKVAVPGRTSVHEVARTTTNFRHALQSFIKAIYKRVFDHIVSGINDCFRELRPKGVVEGSEAWNHIGILDIYGFENLQRNSFEQLCINLANERLQQYFVENVLRAEQDLYRREGLPWTGLPLPDAAPVFNAIGQVFKTLDEYSQNLMRNVGNPTDKTFCQRVVDEAAKDPERKEILKRLNFGGNKTGSLQRSVTGLAMNDGFVIKHYAGQVQYNTSGWLDKNNDRLLPECEGLICESECNLVKSLGDPESLGGKAPTFRSISKKYSQDLQALLDTLSTCNLHYIRCFKPNGDQVANKFQGSLVLDQIVQCGTIELVRIMHDGYPNRTIFTDMVKRFRDLLPERFQRYGERTFIEALMLAYEVPKEQWALGTSKLFLKAGQLRALESMRQEGATPPAEKLSEIVRGIIRKRWVRSAHAVMLCNFLPKFAAHIYAKRAAKALSKATVLTSRLAVPLEAAKKRAQARKLAARRRFIGAGVVARLTQVWWKQARAKRADRLAAAFRMANFLHVRTRTWVATARLHAAEEETRREAERKREEERRRLEAERLREAEEEQKRREEEQRKAEEEARRLEEEQRRQEEERQRKEAEERRLEDERQLWKKQQQEREEELQRALEQQREEFRMKEEADRKAHEEERRRMEEDRKAWEEEKKRAEIERQQRVAILEAASPSKGRTYKPGDLGSGRRSGAGDSTTRASISDADDFNLGDSVSQIGGHHLVSQEAMQEQVRRLEQEMARKHEEIRQQMQLLQERNASLERQLHEASEERLHKGNSPGDGAAMATHSPPMQKRARQSLIPMEDDDGHHLQTTPNSRKSCSRSANRLSMLSLGEGSASRQSKAKRQSIAAEALSFQKEERGVGDAAKPAENLGSQRRWWAEQRQFLLDDLYPNAIGTNVRSHRVSMSCRPRDLNRVSSVAEEGEDAAGRTKPPVVPQKEENEVRDLNRVFESSEGRGEDDLGAAGSRKARMTEVAGGTSTREPTKFQYAKRHSLNGRA